MMLIARRYNKGLMEKVVLKTGQIMPLGRMQTCRRSDRAAVHTEQLGQKLGCKGTRQNSNRGMQRGAERCWQKWVPTRVQGTEVGSGSAGLCDLVFVALVMTKRLLLEVLAPHLLSPPHIPESCSQPPDSSWSHVAEQGMAGILGSEVDGEDPLGTPCGEMAAGPGWEHH